MSLTKNALDDDSYTVSGAIALLIFGSAIVVLCAAIQSLLPGLARPRAYSEFYPNIFGGLLTICLVIAQHPRVLLLSRWRPRWKDLFIGLSLAIGIQSIPLFFVAHARDYFAPAGTHWGAILSFGFVAPILEETFCRGAALRSLARRMSPMLALGIVSVIVSFGHDQVLEALPRQIAFSGIYLMLGDSLAASISCHIAVNTFVFFYPLASYFERCHIFTIWT